ncbi:MAG: hypothetical protein ISR65_20020 [Bacteriovoracaceae bacterium]|nr:hypothetical protein [Bacteriovoracaceae bacterium]
MKFRLWALLIIILFGATNAFAIRWRSKGRRSKGLFITEAMAGYAYHTFNELREWQETTNVEFTQHSLYATAAARTLLFTRWMGLSADAEYIGPAISSSHEDGYDFSLINLNGSFYFNIPAKPFNLLLTAEYFYTSMETGANDFGYESMEGMKFSAIVDLTFFNGRFNLYLKYPYWIGIEDRTEYWLEFSYKYRKVKNRRSRKYWQFYPELFTYRIASIKY